MSKRENLARMMMNCGLLPAASKFLARGVSILAFHRVGTPSSDYKGDHTLYSINEDEFRKLLEKSRRQFDIVTLDDAVATIKSHSKPRRPALAITFDDGYLDNFSVAAPILSQMSIPATFFICPGLIDDPHLRWWDTIAKLCSTSLLADKTGFSSSQEALTFIKNNSYQKSKSVLAALRQHSQNHSSADAEQMMTWDHVRSLHRQGFEIGAHSLSHRVLSRLDRIEQQWEIQESKHLLELQLKAPVRTFAYPVGGPDHFSEETAQLVEDAGFTAAVSYGQDLTWSAKSENAHLRIPRLAATGSASLILGSIIGLWSDDQ